MRCYSPCPHLLDESVAPLVRQYVVSAANYVAITSSLYFAKKSHVSGYLEADWPSRREPRPLRVGTIDPVNSAHLVSLRLQPCYNIGTRACSKNPPPNNSIAAFFRLATGGVSLAISLYCFLTMLSGHS